MSLLQGGRRTRLSCGRSGICKIGSRMLSEHHKPGHWPTPPELCSRDCITDFELIIDIEFIIMSTVILNRAIQLVFRQENFNNSESTKPILVL